MVRPILAKCHAGGRGPLNFEVGATGGRGHRVQIVPKPIRTYLLSRNFYDKYQYIIYKR